MSDWREYIDFFPEVSPKRAVIKGTEIGVVEILEALAKGYSRNEIRTNFLGLEKEAIDAVLQYSLEMVRDEDSWRECLSDKDIMVDASIKTFFDWIKDGINLAEFMMKAAPFGHSAPDMGLVVAFTLLDVMAMSYNSGEIPKKSKQKLKSNGVGPKTVRNFIEEFKDDSFEFKRKYEIEKVYRDGTKVSATIDTFKLLRECRNRATHFGLPLGHFHRWDEYGANLDQLFVSDSPPLGAKGIYRIISLIPNCLLNLLRQLATSYHDYCIQTKRDPRYFINPEEIRLKKIDKKAVETI